MKIAVGLVVVLVVVYLATCVALYVGQRSLIYFPVPENPTADVDSFRLDADGVRLKIWRVGSGDGPATLYFGGNGEDVVQNAALFAAVLPGHTLYLANYRGYGGSEGRPSEAALYRDATALFDHVQSSHAQISVIGRSLGSGIATYLATQRPVHRVALITPFDSLARVAADAYPMFPVAWLMRDRFESIRRAPLVSGPILVVIADHDQIVRRSHADRLVAALPKPQTRIVVLPGAGHNDLGPGYSVALAAFFAQDAEYRESPAGG